VISWHAELRRLTGRRAPSCRRAKACGNGRGDPEPLIALSALTHRNDSVRASMPQPPAFDRSGSYLDLRTPLGGDHAQGADALRAAVAPCSAVQREQALDWARKLQQPGLVCSSQGLRVVCQALLSLPVWPSGHGLAVRLPGEAQMWVATDEYFDTPVTVSPAPEPASSASPQTFAVDSFLQSFLRSSGSWIAQWNAPGSALLRSYAAC